MDKSKQHRTDQVPTLTEKSSGIEYVKSSFTPPQGEADSRKPSTKNDKGS